MVEYENPRGEKSKQVSGGWVLLFFGALFFGILLLGWLTL
jgi:hypothetical protein